MKLIKIATVFVLVFCYLFFSYIRFYHYIGDMNLQSPYNENSMIINNPKGQGSVKYIALGDSLSAGVGSDKTTDTFVYQHALKLSQKYENVNLLNIAQPGGTTEEVVKDQIPVAIQENPDFVTLLIGVNDIHNKRTINDFRDKYQFIINEILTKTNAHVTVINIPYLGSNKIVYLPFNFMLNFRTKQFNRLISKLIDVTAHNDRINLIDLYTYSYKPFKQNPKYYAPDLFHPSGEGYLFWSRMIDAD